MKAKGKTGSVNDIMIACLEKVVAWKRWLSLSRKGMPR